MRITETHGNSRNEIKGSRISVYTDPLPNHPKGLLIDRFVVPTRYAVAYCLRHPGGSYGERFAKAVAEASPIEIEQWDQFESGDEESTIRLRGPCLLGLGYAKHGYVVRVRDCHEDWRALQGIVPDALLTDSLYERMCAEVGLSVEGAA